MKRSGLDYNAIPQLDKSLLVVCSGDPRHKDFTFTRISQSEAIALLTADSNLFPVDKNGNTLNRRSSRNWQLSKV
jgi:hypothetical protein